ncbi:RES domain-containing protein [Reyranella sp.]|uniref:RES family NAD+ phosphorylase n=1 Tax=Reyranella sp. TaxID=1929291 RepID=UPI0025DEB61F|nr:RES domain-containing protein [Reyranella sp.]
MRFVGTCYRAHDPRWAFSPLSGDGAKVHGGRFNPKGMPALYLALTLEGMFIEMGHGLARRFEPLTVCTYDVDVDDIVDLTKDEGRSANRVTLDDLACAWAADVANKREPASWQLARRLIADGSAGLLVPSFAVGARTDMLNLVLWKWGANLPRRVEVHDPSGRLPKDQLSWR